MLRSSLIVGLGLLAATPAYAVDAYMWGVGPRLGTQMIPGAYPIVFPDKVNEDLIAGTEDPHLNKARGDVIFGVESVYYINRFTRIAGAAGFDVGSGYSDIHAIFRYNYVAQTGALDLLFGGGAGFGQMWFNDKDSEAQLRVPYYPIRLETSLMLRDGPRAYQASLWGQLAIPSNHFYRNSIGEDIDVRGTPFNYPSVGIEIAVLFGDFTPPKRKKKGPAKAAPPPAAGG